MSGYYGPRTLKHVNNILGLLHTQLTSENLTILMLLKCVCPLYVSVYIPVEFWALLLNTFSYLFVLLCYCFVLGSEGSLFTKTKSNSISVADLYFREMAFQRGSPTLPRHSYSVVSQILIHSKLLTSSSVSPTAKLLIIKC